MRKETMLFKRLEKAAERIKQLRAGIVQVLDGSYVIYNGDESYDFARFINHVSNISDFPILMIRDDVPKRSTWMIARLRANTGG